MTRLSLTLAFVFIAGVQAPAADKLDPARIPEIKKQVGEKYVDRNPFRKPADLPKLVFAHRNPWFPFDPEARLGMSGADPSLLAPTGDPVQDMVVEMRTARRYGIDVLLPEHSITSWRPQLEALLEAAEQVDGMYVCPMFGRIRLSRGAENRDERSYELLKEELVHLFENTAKHPRWLKVDGKPVFTVHGPTNFPPDVWQRLFDELKAMGHEGVFLGDVARQPNTPEDEVLSYLTVFAGASRYGQSPPNWWETIYGFMTPLMKEVFPHKIYAADIQASHIQGWNMHESAPDFTLNYLWPRMLEADPDWIQITNWNDEVEHTLFQPTRQNSDGLLTLSQYYIRKWKGQPTLKTDEPRVFFLSAKEIVLGQDLRFDVYGFPAKDPGPYRLTFELLNERLEPIHVFPDIEGRLDALRAETLVAPAAKLLSSRFAVPRVTLKTASGKVVYDKRILRYVPVRADKKSMHFYLWRDVSRTPAVAAYDLKVGGVGYANPGDRGEDDSVEVNFKANESIKEVRLYRNWREVHCFNESTLGPVPEGHERWKLGVSLSGNREREGRLEIADGRIDDATIRQWDNEGDMRLTERSERAVAWVKPAAGTPRLVILSLVTRPETTVTLTCANVTVRRSMAELKWEGVRELFKNPTGGGVRLLYVTPAQMVPFPTKPLGAKAFRFEGSVPLAPTGRAKDYYHFEALMENGDRFFSPPVYVRTTRDDPTVQLPVVMGDPESDDSEIVPTPVKAGDVCHSRYDFEAPTRRVGVDEGGYNFHAIYGGGSCFGTGILYEDPEYGYGGPADSDQRERTLKKYPRILEEDGNRFARFDGKDDFAILPSGAGQPRSYTVMARVRPAALNDEQTVVNLRYCLRLRVLEDGRVSADRKLPESSSEIVSEPVVEAGRWTRLAVTFDMKHLKLYVDGKLVKSVEAKAPVGVRTHHTYASLGADALRMPTRVNKTFNGDIDDVEIVGRALSADEIARSE